MRNSHNWIQTYTGRQFWPLEPHAEDVNINDIAHALSMKCRYTGHCRWFYSVAQHSYLASQQGSSIEENRWLLMHDATEAYLPDVARPVKRELVGFCEIEDRLMEVIANVFGLPMPMPAIVKHVDLVLLATERRDLMATPPIPWRKSESAPPLATPIYPMEPIIARTLFLKRFAELFQCKVELNA